MIVAEIMTREVETLSPNTPLKDAARRMVDGGFSGMPVVDAESRLVGILTEADFIGPRRRGPRSRRLLQVLFGEEDLAQAEVAAELMTTDVLTIQPRASVRTAARLMANEGVKRLPVVEADRHLIGILSRADLLRVFARADDDISQDIRRLIQAVPLPVDEDRVEVQVDDGHVTLSGEVETSGDAAILEQVINSVEGVTAVDNRLTWEVDLRRPEQQWPGFDQSGAQR